MKVIRNILALISFVMAAIFLFFTILTLTVSVMEGKGIAITMTVVFFVLGIILRVPSKYSEELKEKREELGVIASSDLHHVEGLPLSEKTKCNVSVTKDGLLIDGGGTNFKIDTCQIRAAEVKTDTEIAHIVNSSAAKGIVGGLLFGPIGLVVGARATSKIKKSDTYYLIINYTSSSGDIVALMFDGGNTPFGVRKIVSKLKTMIVNNPKQTIHL